MKKVIRIKRGEKKAENVFPLGSVLNALLPPQKPPSRSGSGMMKSPNTKFKRRKPWK
jgi:hypothetical protein